MKRKSHMVDDSMSTLQTSEKKEKIDSFTVVHEIGDSSELLLCKDKNITAPITHNCKNITSKRRKKGNTLFRVLSFSTIYPSERCSSITFLSYFFPYIWRAFHGIVFEKSS